MLQHARCSTAEHSIEKVDSPRGTSYRNQHHRQLGENCEQRISRRVSHLQSACSHWQLSHTTHEPPTTACSHWQLSHLYNQHVHTGNSVIQLTSQLQQHVHTGNSVISTISMFTLATQPSLQSACSQWQLSHTTHEPTTTACSHS